MEIIGLPSRSARRDALAAVPEAMQTAVRIHVERHFALWPNYERLIKQRALGIAALPKSRRAEVLDRLAPSFRQFVEEEVEAIDRALAQDQQQSSLAL